MSTEGKPTIEQILKAVRSSGYLMEQEVASKLEELKFDVKTNAAFEDKEEGKSREIDIFATKEFYRNETYKISVYVGLICECKNNSNPFIFLGRNKNKTDERLIPKEFVFPNREYSVKIKGRPPGVVQRVPAFTYFAVKKKHHFFLNKQKAVQFCKIVRQGKGWKAQHDGIYDGIFMPLTKALEFKKLNLIKHSSRWNYIFLYYPSVILQSNLYYIDSEKKDPIPKAVNHITFVREIKSKDLDGRYLIEFINQDSIGEFIENTVTPMTEYLRKLIIENPKKFIKR